MTMPEVRPTAYHLGHGLVGVLGVISLPCLFLTAVIIPGAEPFSDWTHYFGEALRALGASTGVLAAGALPITAGYLALRRRSRPDQAQAAIKAMLVSWRFVPLMTVCTVVWLIAETFSQSFGLSQGRKLPDFLRIPFLIVGLPLWGLAIMVVAGWRMRAVAIPRFRALRNACVNCGYSRAGLPTTICPECGNDPVLPRSREGPAISTRSSSTSGSR